MLWKVKYEMSFGGMCLMMALVSVLGCLSVIYEGESIFFELEVLIKNSLAVEMVVMMDWISLVFMSFVFFISSMVLFYSGYYMAGEWKMGYFILMVMGFVLSMILLVISPNMVSMLVGWDGLGLTSYLLVIFYQNEKSCGAGMLTILANRMGDVAVLMAIGLMFSWGSWSYTKYFSEGANAMIVFMVLFAAMTKSAQIPFSAWLPAAMAAPTPVSALVHSSTLVTAGVYLLIRFSSYFSGGMGNLLVVIGGSTMVMAGLSALYEYDLKKIIALSTLSQLGLMVSSLGMGMYWLAFFHLLTHAMFKALLFMCAGGLIHGSGSVQDIRSISSSSSVAPVVSSVLLVANLALCGVPFLAGFYSKDLILEMIYLSSSSLGSVLVYIFGVSLTIGYSLRLMYYSLCTEYSRVVLMTSETSGGLSYPVVIMGVMSVVSGAALSWMIFPTPMMISLSPMMQNLTLVLLMSIIGGGVMIMLSTKVESLTGGLGAKMNWFIGSMWFMVEFSSYSVPNFTLMKTSGMAWADKGWFEDLGGAGSGKVLNWGAKLFQTVQDNIIKVYMVSFFLWCCICLI